jgi:phosphoribosylamine--glycine ligase
VRLLVIGGGGREHALCWALRRENPGADLYCAPGNPGTAEVATNLPIAADDLDRLADAADMHGIDLTVVGPEVPLAQGLADRLRAEGRRVFGPDAAAAQLEASKAFAKEVLTVAGVPTAASRTFRELQPALDYVARHAEPLVVKASGLAAGKGAVVCASREEAASAVRGMLAGGSLGDAGRTVVTAASARSRSGSGGPPSATLRRHSVSPPSTSGSTTCASGSPSRQLNSTTQGVPSGEIMRPA